MRIFFASTERLLVEGIKLLLADKGGYEFGETFESLDDIANGPRFKLDDVIILTEPGFKCSTMYALRKLQSSGPGTPVVLITTKNRLRGVALLFRYSVRAILLEDCRVVELCAALKTVSTGQAYLTPGIAQAVATTLYRDGPRKIDLSLREIEVLGFLVKGTKIKDIAKELSLSAKTVSSHKSNIQHRLNLRGTSEIVQYAIEHDMVMGR
jgi:DNA-binding NarL/FixJ family response regulator